MANQFYNDIMQLVNNLWQAKVATSATHQVQDTQMYLYLLIHINSVEVEITMIDVVHLSIKW